MLKRTLLLPSYNRVSTRRLARAPVVCVCAPHTNNGMIQAENVSQELVCEFMLPHAGPRATLDFSRVDPLLSPYPSLASVFTAMTSQLAKADETHISLSSFGA